MKRLEDQLKDHFEHFQPEVDSAVWQHISQQLPQGPGPVPSVKNVASVAGSKAVLIAVGLAAVVTAGVVLSKVFVSNKESVQPSPAAASEQIIPDQVNPDEAVHLPSRKTSPFEDEKPAEKAPRKDARTALATLKNPSTTVDTQHQPNDKPAGQTALTGQMGPDKGGATAAPPAPVASHQPAANTVQSVISNNEPTPPTSGSIAGSPAKPILILSTSRGFAPLTVTFMTNLEGGTADYDFGDGNATYGKSAATHRYEESGLYEVTCTINNQVLKSTVTVSGRIPSAFSPNGDGINDRFTIDNPERILLDIRIYSRSGQLVFSGKGSDTSWDGRLPSGDPAPDGTYLVHILAPSFEGASNQQKGTIQLFR